MKILKKEAFKLSENNKKYGFDRIHLFLNSELGTQLKCPECNNSIYFQIFFETEIISVNTIIDPINKIWRIEQPNMGLLKIKNIKCLDCGFKNNKEGFKYE